MATKSNEIWENGRLVGTETIEVPVWFDNSLDVRERARVALATNATYLAQPAIPASPTLAQLTAATRIIRQQVDALTRQANGLIRLELSDLANTDDT